MEAQALVSIVAKKLAEKLASEAYQQICLAFCIETEVERLKEILEDIRAVLSDAEKKQTQNQQLQVWLSRLKDALYDAEDVLDEFESEFVKRKVVKQYWTTPQKVGRFFSFSNPLAFRFKMGNKIKQIRERFDEIAEQKRKFHLNTQIGESSIDKKEKESSDAMYKERETHSFVNVSDVIGRDNDKENVITLLLEPNDDRMISVISIVGIGGLGKTALAKLVYNDERVNKDFELKMWVCVSENFDIKTLAEKITESATNSKQNFSNLEQSQKVLRDSIVGKKYLLILDDVWNEDPMKWEKLEVLLSMGANGSKILVTTRSNKLASIIGSIHSYGLSGLPHDLSVELFSKFAFKEGEEKKYPNLLKIGGEIVEKCKGVPLAVKTLASLLFQKTDEKDWRSIRDNEIWELEQGEKENKILPALRLSYENLPSYLKRCFVYCSLYPKDFDYVSFALIQFWMACGLITQSRNEKEELEDVGWRYLKELASRSFFQDFVYLYGYLHSFKMHDLLHDLALSLMQDECRTVTSKNTHENISKNVRHLLFGDTNGLDLTKLKGVDHVRTIACLNMEISQSAIDLLCSSSKFQYLRMLNLAKSKFDKLPERISVLKHLRFLDLSQNSTIRKLPNALCKLHNLQTLILTECCEIEELPSDIRYMISLRHLWLTTKQKHLPKNGIGCLKSLRFLVIAHCDNLECLFEDMQDLKSLQTLFIIGCTSLISLPQSMKSLTALEALAIKGCFHLDLKMEGGEDNQEDFRLFSLQKLSLGFLPKLEDFPEWLLQGSTNTLQFLGLEYCGNLKELPLCLKDIASLQELNIQCCYKLHERFQPGKGEDWFKIAHIPDIKFISVL